MVQRQTASAGDLATATTSSSSRVAVSPRHQAVAYALSDDFDLCIFMMILIFFGQGSNLIDEGKSESLFIHNNSSVRPPGRKVGEKGGEAVCNVCAPHMSKTTQSL